MPLLHIVGRVAFGYPMYNVYSLGENTKEVIIL